MTVVTPNSIIYAAVQLRWFLGGSDDWRVQDGLVDMEDFYRTLEGTFERWSEEEEGATSEMNLANEFKERTIEWWNEYVSSP